MLSDVKIARIFYMLILCGIIFGALSMFFLCCNINKNMILINKHHVKPGDTLKVKWYCAKSSQVTLQLYNGYSMSQIDVGNSGYRKFRLKRFNNIGSISIVYHDKSGREKREVVQLFPYMTIGQRFNRFNELRKRMPQERRWLLVILLICILSAISVSIVGSKFAVFGFLIISIYILFILSR